MKIDDTMRYVRAFSPMLAEKNSCHRKMRPGYRDKDLNNLHHAALDSGRAQIPKGCCLRFHKDRSFSVLFNPLNIKESAQCLSPSCKCHKCPR